MFSVKGKEKGKIAKVTYLSFNEWLVHGRAYKWGINLETTLSELISVVFFHVGVKSITY